jgi:four helix bundle protein
MDVWQKSMDLVSSIYLITKTFPKDETYTLTNQMRRAAISVPSNIAEGRAKRTTRDFMRFINIASGSIAELETQLIIGERLGYMSQEQSQSLLEIVDHVGRMLNKLHASLERKLISNP